MCDGKGHFDSTIGRQSILESVMHYSFLYCPWILNKYKSPCERCGCSCRGQQKSLLLDEEISERVHRSPSPSSAEAASRKTLFSVLLNANTAESHLRSTVVANPPTMHIPRMREFKSDYAVVDCWRYGRVNGRSVVPLFELMTASQRQEKWSDYTDKWWKASKNKQAFARIQRKISAIVSFSDGKCSVEQKGIDTDWKKATEKYLYSISK